MLETYQGTIGSRKVMNIQRQFMKNLVYRFDGENQLAARSQWGLLLWFVFILTPVLGHCSVSIMPLEAKLQIRRPGARLTNDIEVYNNGDTPIHVTTSVADWSMTTSGQKLFYEIGTQPLSCSPWIQMNPVEFSLPPRKSMRVRYSIAPPNDIEEEHHAMIFFTSRAVPKEGDNRFALNVQTRIGCKVLVTPALKAPLQGKITGMMLQTPAGPESLPVTASAFSPSRVKITFVNPNPVSVRLKGIVEARDADGALVAKGEITPVKALALVGATRELWAQFDKTLPPGTYQIRAMVDYGGKELVGGTLRATVNLPGIAPAAPELSATPAENRR